MRPHSILPLAFNMCLLPFAIFPSKSAFAFTYFADGANLVRDAKGKIVFHVSAEVPSFSEKAGFDQGQYASVDDKTIYLEVVTRAMDLWNKVPGKYYTLALANDTLGKQDNADNLNSISFGSLSITAGASANPIVGNNGQNIVDCDITIPESSSLSYFAKALAHELGHCIGLGHEHKDMYALMSYNFSEFRVTLDDAAGAATLYPSSSHSADKNFVPCGALASARAKKDDQRWPFRDLVVAFVFSLPLLTAFFKRKV
jgi:hypothetical protein